MLSCLKEAQTLLQAIWYFYSLERFYELHYLPSLLLSVTEALVIDQIVARGLVASRRWAFIDLQDLVVHPPFCY